MPIKKKLKRLLEKCILHVPTSIVSDCSVVMLLQCLSLLVLNSPYNRLKQGLLTKVARQLRPLLALKGKLIG